MKTIKAYGVTFEIEDKHNFIAMDEDGAFWSFMEKPKITDITKWNSFTSAAEVYPILDIKWDKSLVKV